MQIVSQIAEGMQTVLTTTANAIGRSIGKGMGRMK
jgi:predicted metal-dependent phosphotriesterase family hydrolase